jgi:hypothetical protein
MKLDNYLYLGKTDVSFIEKELKNLSDDVWDIETIRQKIYDAHRNTKTINLMWSLESISNKFLTNKKTKEYNLFDIDSFLQKIKKLYVNQYGLGEFKRIILTKLNANSNIDMHQDLGASLKNCIRTHIPIITNSDVYFIVDGESKNMKVGEIWEIDNSKPHMVMNESNIDRVHLIIDYDTKYFNFNYS